MKKNSSFLEGKNVVVTGGLGSIGTEIIDKLLTKKVRKIRILDNRETELFYALTERKDKRIEGEFLDVRDYRKVQSALRNADIVFHAAAMKHVIMCEDNPYDAIKTNIIGTQNVIQACVENNVEKMILISTDKAVNPTNVMGASKLLAERLVSAVVTSGKRGRTVFGVVRFGNVLSSRGSVLEIWKKQLEANKPLSITDEHMTRFFMSIPQSVNLIFEAAKESQDGEIFILKMPSVRIADLATAFLDYYNVPNHPIRIIGRRKGEKVHEELVLEKEENNTYENKHMFVKLPDFVSDERKKTIKKAGYTRSDVKVFSSEDESYLLDIDAIKRIIKTALESESLAK